MQCMSNTLTTTTTNKQGATTMNKEVLKAYYKAAKAHKALNEYTFEGTGASQLHCEYLQKEYNKAAREYQEAKAKNKG